VDAPSAFHSPLNQALLTNPGIGRHSPTMIRRKGKPKVSKQELAIAVRKHFNGLAVSEHEVVGHMMYKIRSNGIYAGTLVQTGRP
jgi:histone deacetylase complex subunit SAP30